MTIVDLLKDNFWLVLILLVAVLAVFRFAKGEEGKVGVFERAACGPGG